MRPQKISDLYTIHQQCFMHQLSYKYTVCCYIALGLFQHLHAGMAGFTVHAWRVSDGAVYPTEHHHVGKAVNPEQPF